MKNEDFEYLCRLLKTRSGLELAENKSYLLENRLMPVLRKHALKDIQALTHILKAQESDNLAIEVTEAMTTNETLFFRDMKPFDLLKHTVIPAFLKKERPDRTIRIWSAACSTGQEPYSMAILFEEMASELRGWRPEIIATDLSTSALRKAEAGMYSQFEVQRGLPIQYLVKYFSQNEDKWQIKPSLKQYITFQYFNLLENFTSLGTFDIVFCRNVLIYFDQETKTSILDKISHIIVPDGYLVLGGAETVLGISEKFQPAPEHRGLYIHTDSRTQKQ